MPSKQKGFTIVELLIVIVVIGILAAISIVAYSGIQARAQKATLISDLASGAKQLRIDQTLNDLYPATLAAANNGKGIRSSPGTTYRYSVDNTSSPRSFCLAAISGASVYMITEQTTPVEGSCVNIALGASSPNVQITDGNIATGAWWQAPLGLASVTVDLGSSQDVSMVKVWHYYGDVRTYYNTKTEVSSDGTNWTTLYDSAVSGTYSETSSGKILTFSMQKVRYIRDWLNGSTANPGSHWVEIQAF